MYYSMLFYLYLFTCSGFLVLILLTHIICVVALCILVYVCCYLQVISVIYVRLK
jgi:hypothetical protein